MRSLLSILALSASSIALAAVCANADFDLFSNLSATGDTTGASDSFEPSCQTTNGADLSYEWIAPSTGAFIVDTEGSTHPDTIVAVYASDCTTELACDDDGGTGLLSTTRFDAVAGSRYLIVVDSYNATAGAFQLNIAPVALTTCSNDATGAVGVTYTGTTCGAGDDVGDVSCTNSTGNEDVVYAFTPTVSGTYTFDLSGSAFDTVMSVRATSDCDTELECDDDSGVGTASSITMDLDAGVTYSVVIDGYNNNSGTPLCGDFTLSIYDGCPDDDADGICNADDICTGDDTSGDSDIDGICDDLDFNLTVGTPTRGQRVALSVANAEPGSNVVFLLSTAGTGAGPCHPTAGICAAIRQPKVAGSVRADAAGRATFNLPVPTTAPAGANVYFQAAFIGAAADTTEVERRQVQ